MWSRRGWLECCASALATAGLSPLRAQPSAPLPAAKAWQAPLGRVSIAVDDKTSFCYLPLTVAERLGYFAAAGLEVQVREYGKLDAAVQAVLGGQAQVFCGPYGTTIVQQLLGHAWRSIVLQGRTPQLVLGVSHQTLAGFRHLRELRGRRVAVTAMGSASHRIARLLLARAGLGAQDVRFQAFDGPEATVAAFRAGQVDALCYHDPVITRLEQFGTLRVVADTRTLRGSADVFGGPLPAGSLSAPVEFVEQQPRQCQAMADAMVRALKWLQTAGPSDLNRTVPEPYFQGDRALYLAAFSRAREAWVPDGLMPEAGPQTVLRLLAQFGDGQQLQRVDLAQTFTNQFAQVAKARWRA